MGLGLGLVFRASARFNAFQQAARAGGGYNLQPFRGLLPPKL